MQTLHSNSTLQGGKYRIIKVLGQGGFGITYLAEQVMLGRMVAIKEFFYKEYCDREEGTSHVTLGTQSNRETVQRFMNKFLKEARTISQLDHPNIIKIYGIFEENNTAYYVMEYIEGENLSEMVKHQGALPEATAVAYIKKVADALAYIHARSINHLDVKPGNIMLRKHDQQIMLIDFGLSKQYDDVGSQTSSTPIGVSQGYAPVEQYSPGGVPQFSPQTDIYSLGATLYWLVVGKTPPSAHEVLNDGIRSFPAYVSFSIQKAIRCAMRPKKADRPQSVNAFLKMFDEGKSMPPPPPLKRLAPPPPPSSSKATWNDEETHVIQPPKINSSGMVALSSSSGAVRAEDESTRIMAASPYTNGSVNSISNKPESFIKGMSKGCLITLLIILPTVLIPITIAQCEENRENTSNYTAVVESGGGVENEQEQSVKESHNSNKSKPKQRTDSSPKVDSQEQEVKDFITFFYAAYVWGGYEFKPSLVSPSVLKRLRQDYDYDDEGYAVWDFRTDEYDGPSGECRITAVFPEGNDWYKVTFLDNGNNGVKHLKVSYNKGTMRIEDFR